MGHLHGVGEVVQRVLVNERHQADHERHGAVAADHVGVAAVLQQHVQQLVAELPVAHVAQHARQRRVARLVDRRSRTLRSGKKTVREDTTHFFDISEELHSVVLQRNPIPILIKFQLPSIEALRTMSFSCFWSNLRRITTLEKSYVIKERLCL